MNSRAFPNPGKSTQYPRKTTLKHQIRQSACFGSKVAGLCVREFFGSILVRGSA